jgi:Flp pilus assembly protein TadG
MAMILLPLIAFVGATFDFAVAITMQNTMYYAVRQGVRYAITSQTVSGLQHDASIKSKVVMNAMGMMPLLIPANADPNDYIAITYYNPTTLTAVTGSGSNRGGNICQVSVTNLAYKWMVPLMRGAGVLPISASSADIMEASPNGITPAR